MLESIIIGAFFYSSDVISYESSRRQLFDSCSSRGERCCVSSIYSSRSPVQLKEAGSRTPLWSSGILPVCIRFIMFRHPFHTSSSHGREHTVCRRRHFKAVRRFHQFRIVHGAAGKNISRSVFLIKIFRCFAFRIEEKLTKLAFTAPVAIDHPRYHLLYWLMILLIRIAANEAMTNAVIINAFPYPVTFHDTGGI